MRASDQTARAIETVYMAADAVLDAYKAVNRIPFDARPALDLLLDGKVYPSDLDNLAKQLKALADEWQCELDDEGAASLATLAPMLAAVTKAGDR